VQALPPQYVAQLKQADDSMLTQFAKILTQNVLLLRQADSAGIKITPEEWQGLQSRYRSQLDTLRADMGLGAATLGDSSVSQAERRKVATLKLEEYFDKLVSGKTRLRQIPSALATVLRDRSSYKIHDAGINQAVEIATAATKKADSARAGTGPLQPAPGPAPIPGMTPGAGPQGQGAPAPKGGKGTPAPKTAPAPKAAPTPPAGASSRDSAAGTSPR
jgi:hypothetical protein